MSFSGQSNTPWQRNVMQGHHQTGAFHQGPPQMFMQQSQQQQNNMAAFAHGSSGIPNSGNMFQGGGGGGGGGGNAVSYPTTSRTALNPMAFQQTGGNVGANQPQHYNSIGTVTKLNNDCGLVNDEVFFYRNACKGPEPKLGDRVIFEATYAHAGQFKWNATRIQVMQHQPQPQPLMGNIKPHGHTGYNPSNRHNSPNRMSPIRGGGGSNILDCHGRNERERRDRDRMQRSRDKDDNEHARKRRREDLDHNRDRERAISRTSASASTVANISSRTDRERERNDTNRRDKDNNDRDDRERERERGRDKEVQRTFPKSRRSRAIRRYMVQIPKYQLVYKTADLQELRQRYNNLYIPSDFFFANIKWSDSFTAENPFMLKRPCKFHIMHKNVEPPFEQKRKYLEPTDANYLYSAKVMLLAMPTIMEIYQKCFENVDGDDDSSGGGSAGEPHPIHPSRIINFLVGVRGRNEPMAIGGPWSPSLDGENPEQNPAVLIRTAIRTCKALTGIDLSNCTQWYRFVELYYHRTEYKNKEKDDQPRIETVVIFLPDIHSCVPTLQDWNHLSKVYKLASENLIARLAVAASNKNPPATAGAGINADASKESSTDNKKDAATLAAVGCNSGELPTNVNNDCSTAQLASASNNYDTDADKDQLNDASSSSKSVAAADANENVNCSEVMDKNSLLQPTHYSLLDLKTMKIQAIKDELLARNLSDKGVRNILMARLAKALNQEKSAAVRSNATQHNQKVGEEVSENSAAMLNDEQKMDKTADKDMEKMQTKPIAKTSDSKSVWKIGKDKQKDKHKEQNNDESEDWADIIDFEMSDIVILDEYDANLVTEETSPKELDEKEKSQLIRRYSLPTQPQIIVHPNKQAKGGKFDCAVMSLSVLLDYHPEDTKERFFEVSLFAELFNEMLMRDFGFNIYKEAYIYKDPTSNKTEKSVDENPSTETKDTNKDDKGKDDHSNSADLGKEDGKDATHHEDDTQSMKSETCRKRERDREVERERERERDRDREASVNKDKKMVLVKPELLLSFVYFDTTHCGYIFEKDLEDLFALLDLNLSRGQIKKVLSKLSSRQAIYYRKLTDKEETPDQQPYAILDDNEGELSKDELHKIAAGNWIYGNVYSASKYAHLQIHNEEEKKKMTDVNNIAEETTRNDDLIDYNGTVVHVGKLIEQIKRTENTYFELLKVNNELQKQHEDLQKEQNKSNNKIKNLQSDVKSLTRKLSDANQELTSINRKYRDQHACLSHIYNRISPYFQRDKDSKDSKDSKIESSKDRDIDKGKDKDKDKDKEKEKDKLSKDKDKENEKDKSKEDKTDKAETEKNSKTETTSASSSSSDNNDMKTKNTDLETEANLIGPTTTITTNTTTTNTTTNTSTEKDLNSDTINNEN